MPQVLFYSTAYLDTLQREMDLFNSHIAGLQKRLDKFNKVHDFSSRVLHENYSQNLPLASKSEFFSEMPTYMDKVKRDEVAIENLEIEISALKGQVKQIEGERNFAQNYLNTLKNNPKSICALVEKKLNALQKKYDNKHPAKQDYLVRLFFYLIQEKLDKINEIFRDSVKIKNFLDALQRDTTELNDANPNRLQQIKLYFISMMLWKFYDWFTFPHIELVNDYAEILLNLHIENNGNLPDDLCLKLIPSIQLENANLEAIEQKASGEVEVSINLSESKTDLIEVKINIDDVDAEDELPSMTLYDFFEEEFPTEINFATPNKKLQALDKRQFEIDLQKLEENSGQKKLITELEKILEKPDADFKFYSIIIRNVLRFLEIQKLEIKTFAEKEELEAICKTLVTHIDDLPGSPSGRKLFLSLLSGAGSIVSGLFTLSAFNKDFVGLTIEDSFQNKVITTAATGVCLLTTFGLFYSNQYKGVAKEVKECLSDKAKIKETVLAPLL